MVVIETNIVKVNPRITLVKDTLLSLCGNDNTYPLDVANYNLFNSCEFPAHMKDDEDNYSTTYYYY